MKKADAILCADIHLQDTTPVCRLDKFDKTQFRKIKFLKNLQKEHQCTVLCGGDLFHRWNPTLELVNKTITALPNLFYTVYGQHDLPQHSIDLEHKCGTYTLMKAQALELLPGCHWKMTPKDIKETMGFGNRRVLVWHKFTYKGAVPWPGCTDPTARQLLKKYPQFDLILTGDNHQTFVEKYEGRVLVNPGSLFRTTAAQIDHKPCVFLYYADTNTVEQVFIPIEENVISREHLEKTEEREERINAFVSSLDTEWEAELSFEKNLELFYRNNRMRKNVKQIILKSLEA